MSRNKRLIGISGDNPVQVALVVSMINYLTYNGVVKSTYADYLRSRDRIKKLYDHSVISTDDVVKDIVSMLYGIDLDILNAVDKQNHIWLFDQEELAKSTKANTGKTSLIELRHLQDRTLNLNSIISIRSSAGGKSTGMRLGELVEYVKTNVISNNLRCNILDRVLSRRLTDIMSEFGYCIVTNVNTRAEMKLLNSNIHCHGIINIKNDIISDVIGKDGSVYEVYLEPDNKELSLFYKIVKIITYMNEDHGYYR